MIRNYSRCVLPVMATAAVFLLASHGAAEAYIDPGTGGMLLQLLLGGIAGSLVIIKLYWFRLRQAVELIFGTQTKPNQTKPK